METEAPEKQSPFATEPIGRLILKFAVPSVIALLVNSLYNIVDQIFIGWGVGYLGNGATNVVFPITIIALALSMMIGNGGAAFLSLKLGEGELDTAKKGVGNAVRRHRHPAFLHLGIWLHHRSGPALHDDFRGHQLHDPR